MNNIVMYFYDLYATRGNPIWKLNVDVQRKIGPCAYDFRSTSDQIIYLVERN